MTTLSRILSLVGLPEDGTLEDVLASLESSKMDNDKKALSQPEGQVEDRTKHSKRTPTLRLIPAAPSMKPAFHVR